MSNTMRHAVTRPAPLWRRLAAAVYDGLLLIALWMVALLLDVVVRDQLLGLPRSFSALQALLFLIGLAFFGGFWVRGGQTLGMRAWRLATRRLDGSALRWPVAAVRYTVLLVSWGLVVVPALSRLPPVAVHWPALVMPFSVAALLATAGAIILMQLDARRRLPCDFLSGTEVVLLPRQAAVAVAA